MTPRPIFVVSATNWRRVTFLPVMKAKSSVVVRRAGVRRSERHLFEVSLAVGDRRDGIRWLIVLHEIVLDASLGALGEDSREVDGALPHVDHLVLRRARRVLDVNHLEPARIAIEEVERLPAAENHPVEIHLEINHRGIGAAEKEIERPDAFYIRQLEIVIVVSNSKPL